jgi:hypothetical protein
VRADEPRRSGQDKTQLFLRPHYSSGSSPCCIRSENHPRRRPPAEPFLTDALRAPLEAESSAIVL